ncbi:MAG TPA: penicillin-binding protein 2 [Bacteroidales bacterium]|nr:penicillin-binding protein 2 [Bacteroidales bacterium]
MKQGYSERRYIISAIFVIVAVIFVIRLFYIQVIDDSYKKMADNNTLRILTEYPARGLIYDKNGKLLVYNEATYDLMVVPKEVKNIDTADLCKLLGISREVFQARFDAARRYSPWVPSIFEKQIPKELYGFVQEKLFKFPGFYIQARTVRKYPLPIAPHVLGNIGEVNQNIIDKDHYYALGDYIGLTGIEKYYEKVLRGRKGRKIVMVDVFNREKGTLRQGVYNVPAIQGFNLYTYIDADLQQYGEALMRGKRGSIVAIDPSTGGILAIVSSPSYDPNCLVGRNRGRNFKMLLEDKSKPLFDRALMAQYPPGSTFKLVNALIGQQEKVVFPNTIYSCGGGFTIGGGKIVRCHAHASPLNLLQSVQVSCNTYYCKVFKSIIEKKSYKNTREGFEVWRKYVIDMGFGRLLGSDLPNELPGNIPTPEVYDKIHGKNKWKALSIISLAIGQGEILITPLQLANLGVIIANKGWYYPPHVVKAIGMPNYSNPLFNKKVYVGIDSSYFDIVKEGMLEVVEAGTAANIRMFDLKICGKTGTAQNPHGANHSLFVAFAPYDKPKIVVSVVVENAGYGATWAAPIAGLIIEKYLYGKILRKDLETRMLNGIISYK